MDRTRTEQTALQTGDRYYQLASRDLVYLKFIMEAYEGLSTMSTVDGKRGIVRINYPLPFAENIAGLMAALAKEIELREVTEEELAETAAETEPKTRTKSKAPHAKPQSH